MLLEELDRRAEQEAVLGLAAGGYLGDCLAEAAAGLGDLAKRASSAARDSLAEMFFV